MAQQTSYLNNPAPALNGMMAHLEGNVTWSRIADGVVPIGTLVAKSTNGLTPPSTDALGTDGHSPGQVKLLPSGISDDPILDSEYIGIAAMDMSRMATDQITTLVTGTLTLSAYADKMAVPIMRKGVLWVYSESAVTEYADAYVRVTADTNIPRGVLSAGSGANKVKFARGRWLETTSGAGIALLEVW